MTLLPICENGDVNMRMKFNKRVVTAVAVAAAAALNSAIAGNDLNPDSLELLPLPAPVEFKSDIDRPVPSRLLGGFFRRFLSRTLRI